MVERVEDFEGLVGGRHGILSLVREEACFSKMSGLPGERCKRYCDRDGEVIVIQKIGLEQQRRDRI